MQKEKEKEFKTQADIYSLKHVEHIFTSAMNTV